MLKKVQETAPVGKLKAGPSAQALNAILNYSRSLEVTKIKKQKVLIHLN